MIQTDRISELICKYKINPTQVYILWLLYTDDVVNMKKYIEVFGQFKREDFEELELKGLLIHTNRDATSYRTTDLIVTLEFAEELGSIDPDDAFEELFNIYPSHLRIGEKKVPAKTLTFTDDKLAREAYAKVISKAKFMHHKILSLVNKWKDENNGYATIKIDKFISGRYWEALENKEDDGIAKTSYY